MQVPINEYYTDVEYEYALRQMYRMMERNRILAEARVANAARDQLKESFKSNAKVIARDTKAAITSINAQMDTAIRGNIRKSLETYVPNMLAKYDSVGER